MVHIQPAGLNRHGIGIAFWILCGLATPVLGATDSVRPVPINAPADTTENLHDFNIPPQPLETALYQYAEISGQPALFASDMMDGRSSPGVYGRYSSAAALRLLLEGTGLVVEKIDSDHGRTFLLKDAGGADNNQNSVPSAAADNLNGYPGLVQARIWQALCADPHTAPGRYRSLFSFQVDATGHIQDAHLLDSSGNAQRDTALLATLQRVQLELPPPATLAQPLVMTLLPAAPNAGSPCNPGNGNKKGAR
jgi:TonB family protein